MKTLLLLFASAVATFGQSAPFEATLAHPFPPEPVFSEPARVVTADVLVPAPDKEVKMVPFKQGVVKARSIARLKRPLEFAGRTSGNALDKASKNDLCSGDQSCANSRKDSGNKFQRVKK